MAYASEVVVFNAQTATMQISATNRLLTLQLSEHLVAIIRLVQASQHKRFVRIKLVSSAHNVKHYLIDRGPILFPFIDNLKT